MKIKSLEKIIKDSGVIFNEDEHIYMNVLGEFYTGCTTISDAWKKEFIAPWYAKEAILAVKANLGDLSHALESGDIKAVDMMLDEAKMTASRKGKEAQATGTEAHGFIERLAQGTISRKGFMEKNPVSKEVVNAVSAFIEWDKPKNIIWLASEEVVASHKYKVAGTLDALAIIDGVPTIVDFKTSSQLSESALIQCAGYDIMLSEMGFPVRQWIVLRLPKDGSPAEDIVVNDLDLMQFYRETFLHLREAHKFFVYADSHLKGPDGKMMTNKHPVEELHKQPKHDIIKKKKVAVKKKIVGKKPQK